ncbi:hypothetical protein AU468_01540 [Alkalispirochaeta sphaeroplastigenens]|uniref:diguanylate cyclase n=1 Tax=Alkalispirochaeta sphaeroplastigenens TaxID=1187066 RepID=A0A2S4K0V7_9SPIO|nr:GGDEF domain-containing protein [Alkalispirochaeta sphaeroplastigenens]POR05386.1 hypothetical protein AU468_01540 [Alkalispirochaeta sphaeroplastigenens]
MIKSDRYIFGSVHFPEDQEHLEFQFKFLVIVIVGGAALTWLFLVANRLDVNPLDSPHLVSMRIFTAMSLLLWWLLRGRPHRFRIISWLYLALCLLEYTSAVLFVPSDELRILWFITSVPGVFLILGVRIGWIVTFISLSIVLLTNAYNEAAYSINGITTFTLGMVYLSLFFHFFVNRSVSYYSRLQESNRHLRHMASHDMLTGVLNARAYYQSCDQLIRLADRDGSSYSVLFVDLDHFKSVNDRYGHAAGDTVLKSVAQCLAQSIRCSDCIGRIGGEEFSIFLPATRGEAATKLAETIRRAIESLQLDIGGVQYLSITASIGIAEKSRTQQSMKEIQHEADQAMYAAKAGGRNRVSRFQTPVTSVL